MSWTDPGRSRNGITGTRQPSSAFDLTSYHVAGAPSSAHPKRRFRDLPIAAYTHPHQPQPGVSVGQSHHPLRLPVLRRRHAEMGRPLRDLRRMEHHRAERPSPRRPGPRGQSRPPASVDFVGLRRHRRPAAPRRHRHRGTRSRAGRRAGARLGRAGRRRSRHRQIHAAAAGRRRASRQPASACSTSPARKPSSRSACAPAAWASPTRRSNSRPRSTCATSPPAWSEAKDATLVVIDSIQTMWLDASTARPAPSPRCAPARSN